MNENVQPIQSKWRIRIVCSTILWFEMTCYSVFESHNLKHIRLVKVGKRWIAPLSFQICDFLSSIEHKMLFVLKKCEVYLMNWAVLHSFSGSWIITRQRRAWVCPAPPSTITTCATVRSRSWTLWTLRLSGSSSAPSSWGCAPAAWAPGKILSSRGVTVH